MGREVRSGIELRLLGDAPVTSSAPVLCERSRTAPAVLGLESALFREGLRTMGEEASLSAAAEFVKEMIDEMLPESEWPGLAVTVLDVSLETRESGRGMNSSVSENPTLALLAGFDIGFDSSTGAMGRKTLACSTSGKTGRAGPSDLATCLSISGKAYWSRRPKSAGLDGALLPRAGGLGPEGCRIMDRSWLEMAADLL